MLLARATTTAQYAARRAPFLQAAQVPLAVPTFASGQKFVPMMMPPASWGGCRSFAAEAPKEEEKKEAEKPAAPAAPAKKKESGGIGFGSRLRAFGAGFAVASVLAFATLSFQIQQSSTETREAVRQVAERQAQIEKQLAHLRG